MFPMPELRLLSSAIQKLEGRYAMIAVEGCAGQLFFDQGCAWLSLDKEAIDESKGFAEVGVQIETQ